MTFPGYSPAALDFLRKLARNNRRPWFQRNKHIYEQEIKAPTIELVTALNHQLMDFAPGYISPPQKAIFRIYRDTRFSHIAGGALRGLPQDCSCQAPARPDGRSADGAVNARAQGLS